LPRRAGLLELHVERDVQLELRLPGASIEYRELGFGGWAIASAVGWLIGGLLSTRILAILIPDISFTLNLFVFPLIAGAVMGIPLWLVLRRYLPQVGPWWILISAIGPAIQFPGMVMGGAIVWLMSRQGADKQPRTGDEND